MKLLSGASYCSACYQAKPAEAHVDFEAAWDGPVLDAAAAVQIDDLILCETCLAGAVRLLDLDGEVARVAELEQQLAEVTTRAVRAEKALYDARVALGQPGGVARGRGRPLKNPLAAAPDQ